MQLNESIIIGLREISVHKLRSLLTMLGVIFGVGAVISTVAIGAGAREEALQQIKLLGTNNIRIRQASLQGQEMMDAMRKSPAGLTRADATAIGELLPTIRAVAIAKQVNTKIFYKNDSPNATIYGIVPDYPKALGFYVAPGGRFINSVDVEEAKQVCVIGDDLRSRIFPLESAIGQQIKIGQQLYTVIGVMEPVSISEGKKGVLDVGNLNQNVYIPISAAMKRFSSDPRNDRLDEIMLKIADGADLQEIANVVDRMLERRHNGVRDFQILIPEELLRQSQRTQRIFTIVLTAIAGISLVVGGIGIMNIMLATVTQRTREIGVRRAIGATKSDVLAQFMIESLIISLVGGLIGILIGYGFAHTISRYAGWETIISPLSIIISFSVAAATGLLFGLYPSMKAANLDPIEALRYE